ncbi:MAG: hypothetical protein K2I87_05795, partial [Bacteroidales bacterium]|nr:hypothetical protein [Bacteroidales bacterium]
FAAALPALFYLAIYTEMTYVVQVFFYLAAGILSVGGVWALCVLFRKKNHKQQGVRKAVNALGFSLLIAVFAGGWSIPAVNPYIGYRDVCRKAVQTGILKDCEHYHSLYLRRAENMDVFLGEDIRQIAEKDSTQSITEQVTALSNTVLIVRQKKFEQKADRALRQYIQQKERYSVGPYTVVVL